MKISARNTFSGVISAIVDGTVNMEVEVAISADTRLIAIVTRESVDSLGLCVGKPVFACVKAPWVALVNQTQEHTLSSRNQFSGRVRSLSRASVNTEVAIELADGTLIHSVITHEAAMELGLKADSPATALIKASDIILGVTA